MNGIEQFIDKYLYWIQIPDITVIDIIEIAIIAVLLYYVILFLRNTRAWVLAKGIAVILILVSLAAIFEMTTILWLAERTFNVGVIALVIVFQPELRKALEQLGRRQFLSKFLSFDNQKASEERYSINSINEIVKACFEMGKVKTGALIVVEKDDSMVEFERTGIPIDAVISSQLFINIFEHNTPLHDGAVIVRGNRIVSATCYLPLSDNLKLSKELGTRHRAAVGVSEVGDALTIVVSEETGAVSVTERGEIERHLTPERLRERLMANQKLYDENSRIKLWKRRGKANVEENSGCSDK